jgi:hypothetical protein
MVSRHPNILCTSGQEFPRTVRPALGGRRPAGRSRLRELAFPKDT